MGNRAVITNMQKEIGIYLHWGGSRETVEGFLLYCKLSGYKFDSLGFAKLCQVICNYSAEFDVCVDKLENLDCNNYDNGVYVVNEDWEICERLYNRCLDEQSNTSPMNILRRIDKSFCFRRRLGYFFIRKCLKEVTNEKENSKIK